MPTQEEYDNLQAQLADVMAEGGSYRRLQTQLDDTLQLVINITNKYETQLTDLTNSHALQIENLKAEHRAELAAKITELTDQHTAEIAKLKADVLIPAQRDLHERQMKDLLAQHQAELDSLLGK